MAQSTDRFALPLLAAGQAQKELTHNEALALVDALLCPAVEAIRSVPPASPVAGQVWIVGAGPTGAWAGQEGKLACWTGGGWRFIAPREGMTVWSLGDGLAARRLSASWQLGIAEVGSVRIGGDQLVGARLAGVSGPAGGTTIDAEARAAIAAILNRLETHGLIAA